MKGEAVQQIPPLATLGRDDRDGRSFDSGLRPTLRMTEAEPLRMTGTLQFLILDFRVPAPVG